MTAPLKNPSRERRNVKRRKENLELAIFQNAIRAVLGLDPLPLRVGKGREREQEETFRAYPETSGTGQIPRRGSRY